MAGTKNLAICPFHLCGDNAPFSFRYRLALVRQTVFLETAVGVAGESDVADKWDGAMQEG